jgi:hypothetical protein
MGKHGEAEEECDLAIRWKFEELFTPLGHHDAACGH